MREETKSLGVAAQKGYWPWDSETFDQVKAFLEKGGVLAWGIVPSSGTAGEESVESLSAKLAGLMDALTAKGIDRDLLVERCLLTPSCGTGSISESQSGETLALLAGLSEALRA